MKRIILLSFVSMLLSVGTTMAEGISSARELVAFATAANAGEDITPWADREGVISLTADIDMAKVKDFVPIAVFDGIFDGGCHTISNWKTTAGLFHIVSEKAVVRNLTIDASCSMKCTDNGEEEFYAGFIADVNHGTLEGCINRGQISHRSGKSLMSNYVGGICGMNKYIVINCDNYGNVSSSGNFGGNLDNRSAGIYLGGVVGGSPTRPLSCAFIGYCDNHGTITYSGAFPNNYIGGIAGSHTYVKVKFCTNRGNVTVAAKSISESDVPQGLQVGGICGLTKGDIVCSDNFGEIIARCDIFTMAGGIAGSTHSALTVGDCVNYAAVTASGFAGGSVGGIVGQGTDSDLTDGSLIAINNRAIVSVLEGQQYVGAVSGGQDGDFYGNLFVSDDLQGIDRLSRVGQAEPVTYETLLAQENVPDSFRKLTLTFKADGHIIKKISFDYGASFTLDDYPEIPQKNGYYAEWSTPVLDQLHTDTVVNVEYTPYIPSLSSSVTRENGRPVFFVDGFFGGSNAVQVTQQDITADVHGVTEQWLLEFTDDGNETHQIRYLTPGKAKGKVYVEQADGSWHKVETGSFGSYTTFTTTGTEVEVAFVPAKLPIWAFCAGGAALLVLLLLLAKRIKSKRGPKGEKPRREKKGKQPETADTPADELDTPISETDMQ